MAAFETGWLPGLRRSTLTSLSPDTGSLTLRLSRGGVRDRLVALPATINAYVALSRVERDADWRYVGNPGVHHFDRQAKPPWLTSGERPLPMSGGHGLGHHGSIGQHMLAGAGAPCHS